MPEMQSTFIAQHLPASEKAVNDLLASDDSVDLATLMASSLGRTDIERGLERRRAAMTRAQRAAVRRCRLNTSG